MNQVIVIASGKGGTGKTTVCAGLSIALAKQNNRVLVIDSDSGMRGVDIMLGITDDLVYDISDIISGGCTMDQAIYKPDGEYELYCVAAPNNPDDEVSPSLLKEFIEKVKADFDYILIDSPAGTGSGFEAAAVAADRAIVVVNTEPTSIRGAQNIKNRLLDLKITDIRLVINRFDKDRFIQTDIYKDLDEIIDESGIRLIALIPEDIKITTLSQRGAMIHNWSKSGIIFSAMAQRLKGHNVPLVVKV